MNKDFAEWYRKVNIKPTSELLEARWKGVEKFLEDKYNVTDVMNLVRMFYNANASSEFREKFADYFSSIDSAFPRNKRQEHAILSGAILTEIMGSELSSFAMLATISMNFQSKPVLNDIYQQVLQQFHSTTSSIRENIELKGNPNPPPIKTIKSTIGVEGATWNEESRKAIYSYITSLNQFFTELNQTTNENIYYMDVCFEDSNILWWMVGHWSNDLNISYDNIDSINSVAVIAGKELADIVFNVPGPYSAKAVLHQVLNMYKGSKSGQKEFSNIIEGLDLKWRQDVINSYPTENSIDVTPVLTAISKSLEVNGAKEWVPSFNKATGLDSGKIKISSPLTLAYQTYLECLTIKSLNRIGV